jgi:hypothetical protein
MAESRTTNLRVVKILATYDQADTGLTVTLKAAGGGSILATASESPASSGNYVVTWSPTAIGPKFGYWYIGAVAVSTDPVWMGLMGQRSTRIFYDVTVFNSADTPTGAVSAPKTFTTGSGSLATDSDARTDFNFVNVPLVFFCNKQTRMATQIGLVTVSGGNATFTVSVTDDGDNYAAGTTCKADILIVSRD